MCSTLYLSGFPTEPSFQTEENRPGMVRTLHLRVQSQDGTELTLVTQIQASCTAPTSSISHWTTDSTEGCFTTSRRTPPSPPPMISTWAGEGQVRTEQVHSHRTCSFQLQVSESLSTFLNPSVPQGPSSMRCPLRASKETSSPRGSFILTGIF